MSIEEIDRQIKKYKEEYKKLIKTKPEVYARICGYMRPVSNFNKGKAEEYKQRKNYKT